MNGPIKDDNKVLVDGIFSIFKFGIIAWLVSVVVGLGILGTLLYVSYHFLVKVW